MSANQRATRVAREIQRSRAIDNAVRGANLMPLGVWVRGAQVRAGSLRKPLKGACAGLIDLRRPDTGQIVASVVFGGNPKVGTIFVAFADGTRHERALTQGSKAQMQKVDEAIRQFNLMADAADEIERQSTARAADREATRKQRAFAKATRLTWSESKPGRAAYKAARRAGLSRAEASKASAAALAPLKEAKRQPFNGSN